MLPNAGSDTLRSNKFHLFTLNRMTQRMAESVHAAMKLLLLLCFLRTGIRGEEVLTFAQRSYNITFPCGRGFVCYDVRHFSSSKTSDYMAVVYNGELQTSTSQNDRSKCALQIKNLTEEAHRCQKRPGPTAASEFYLLPSQNFSLQCVLLTYVKQGSCDPQASLMWVDETGARLREDSQLHTGQKSSCETTLTVALQRPAGKKFQCQLTVDGQVRTSATFKVKGSGRRRGKIAEPKPEHQGLSMIGAAAGLVGCVVLTALLAAFAINRRRGRSQQPEKSYNTIIPNTEDVVYADVILPVCSDRVWVQECESTEYACVRYK